MKIWIDLINTPQVTFFVPFISEFKKDNHEVVLTCRDSGNTIDLLLQFELPFIVIGEKAGKGFLQKSIFFPRRLLNLFLFIKNQKPDVAVSQSSFYQPIIAKVLNIPCLYTNDNEHARGNLFGFLFATKVILPIALKGEIFTAKWPLKTKLLFYPSVKEAIYLSQLPDLLTIAAGEKNKIYFRPEPWSAQYYDGPENFFDNTILKLSESFEVIILPRDKKQVKHYNQEKFHKLIVAQKPLNLRDIVRDCLLFIGAGGSMSREMAVLEIPVVSIYQAKILCVDKYLIDKGLMKLSPRVTFDELISILRFNRSQERKWFALNEGKESFLLIKEQIYNLLQHE